MYTLFGSEMSYFSGKVRAYLRWKGLSFQEIPPSQDVVKFEIVENIGWSVVPVLKTPSGEYVQDTAEIIAFLEARNPERPALPSGRLQTFVTRLIELYADEWLVLPAMHYRWNHNEDWVYGEFGKTAAPFAKAGDQYEIGKTVGAKFKAFLPALGIDTATIPGIETSYKSLLADLSTHLETHPYMLGQVASYADFAMMGALYAHQYRDPYSGQMMQTEAPRVANYIERTMMGDGLQGFLADGDRIPKTLRPILARQMREQLPVLLKTVELFAEWAKDKAPKTEVPRGLDLIPFDVEGHKGQCVARTFCLLRLQQVLDQLTMMGEECRAATEILLEDVGGEALLDIQLPKRLARYNYKLCIA